MVVELIEVLPENTCQTCVVLHVGDILHGLYWGIESVGRAIDEVEETVRILTTKLCEPFVVHLLRQFGIEDDAVFIDLLLAEEILLLRLFVLEWVYEHIVLVAFQSVVVLIVLDVLHVVC